MGATDLSSDITVREVNEIGGKIIVVDVPDTAVTDDYFSVTLATYGMKQLLSVRGYVHTTNYSVVAAEAPTTAVVAGVLTVTIGGTAVTAKRVYRIYGK